MPAKKKYQKPRSVNVLENVENAGGIVGAVTGAARMVARAATKAVKGGIDLTAEGVRPRSLQNKK